MGLLPLLACLALSVPSSAAEPSAHPRLEAVRAAARDAEAGLLRDLRSGSSPSGPREDLAALAKALDLVSAAELRSDDALRREHESLKTRQAALADSAAGIGALSRALENPEALAREVPNLHDATPAGAARAEAFVARVARLAAPLGITEKPAVEEIALFYLRKRSPVTGGRTRASGPGGKEEDGDPASRAASLTAGLGGGRGAEANFGLTADGSRERADTVLVAAQSSSRGSGTASLPAPPALRADIAPVRGPDAPPPPAKRSGPPDPPLKSTSHQAMADAIVGEFGIVGINGKPDAMQVVITARGGGENGTAHIEGEGGPQWARARLSAMFPGEAPFTDPTDMRLARIDHIINVQGAVNSVAPIKESDPWYVKSGKALKRMPTAAGAVVVTILYDSSKLVDQTFGTSTGRLGGQDFSQASPADLKNTLGAIWMAVKSPFLVEE